MNEVDATVHAKPDVYDPFHNVRQGGTKERRLFRRAMMGEFDFRKFPDKPKLTKDEVKEYMKLKQVEKESKLKKPKPPPLAQSPF